MNTSHPLRRSCRKISRASALALAGALLCGSLASCSRDTYYSSEPVLSYNVRDYRQNTIPNVDEYLQGGRFLFDNRKDTFVPGEITVNNSKFTVSDQLQYEILECVNSYDFLSGFYIIDAETKMSVGYNAEERFFTASTVKAGFALYCLKTIAAGEASLSDTMAYLPKHHIKWTGSIQHSPYGTVYSVKSLIHHMIYESDNVAYYMLQDFFGQDGYNQMAEDLGTHHHITPDSKWDYYSPHDLGLIWQEIYRFKDECPEGALLWEEVTSNQYNELANELTEYETIAHKSGWGQLSYHDAGVVCGKRDYIIVVMTENTHKNQLFYDLTRYCDDIMQEYIAWLDSQM